MAIATDVFRKNVVGSGLMTDDELTSYLAGAPPEACADAKILARRMYDDGKLTRYQATKLLGPQTPRLVIDQYLLLEKIGEGGMGRVYRAFDRQANREVALKMLPLDAAASVARVRRFHQEMQVAIRLKHVNIVETYGSGEVHGTPYFAMELVRGRDMATLVAAVGRLAIAEGVSCVLQAAEGLAFAHANGAIHRDIKPSNLMLDRSGVIKIFDMGLARFLISEVDEDANLGQTMMERLTQKGQVLGTVDYMSPEQGIDARSADARSDTLLPGLHDVPIADRPAPYSGDTPIATLMKHCESPIPSLLCRRGPIRRRNSTRPSPRWSPNGPKTASRRWTRWLRTCRRPWRSRRPPGRDCKRSPRATSVPREARDAELTVDLHDSPTQETQ